jgi:phage terminase large subunit
VLTVSRPDIPFRELVDYGEKSFIKLPIKPYLELITLRDPITFENSNVWDQINQPQIAVLNAINSPKYRFICAALSRRLGKTYIANIAAQLVTLVPGCHVLIMSPNYNLSTISFDLQRNLINTFDLEVSRNNLKDRIIELSNGSTVRMGSVSQVDSCVGRSYDFIIFDEAALSSDGEDAFNVALRPTLDKPNSKAIFISTPRGKKNWFSRFYARGFSEEFPQWISIHADYLENKRMKQEDVDEAKKSMSREEFEQEYMASFNSYVGQVFRAFTTKDIIEELPETLGDHEVFAGLDPGYRDPTAFVVIIYEFTTDTFYIVEEYQSNEGATDVHAKAIQDLINNYRIGNIFIDSAAAQFAGDLAYTYDISTTKSKKDLLPGIAHVQTLFEMGKVKVLSRCSQTIDALGMYQWKESGSEKTEKPIHNIYSHLCDAVRYALYTYTK